MMRFMLRLVVAALFLMIGLPARAADRPNVVVFLADDLGYGDLHCYGNPVIQTPNLDRFASQSVRFTDGYSACAVCSPSRSAILTGRAPLRNGVVNWIAEGRQMHLRTYELSIAALLKNAGYDTCHVGKWHLNGLFNSSDQPQPDTHGFDHWMATQNNAGPSHKDPDNFVRNRQPVGPLQGFSALLVAEEAVGWLSSKRDKSKPFFLNVWTHEPHYPINSDPKFQALYPNLSDQEKQHHGNVTQMDAAFGKVMAALEEMKLAGDTLVFFTSDNGPEGAGDSGPGRGSSGGLRGRKRHVYEGGVRVPFMVRWPGKTRAGTVDATPVIGSDIFATIAAAAGAAPPADRPYDGVSLLPLFAAQPISRAKPLFYHCAIAPTDLKYGMRVGDWKILASHKLDRFEMYDLKSDPTETADQAAAQPQRLAEMKRRIISLVQEMTAETPRFTDKDDFAAPAKKDEAKKEKARTKTKKKQG